MEGFADRPALGQRTVQFVNDPGTGRTVAELLPRFDTITYCELWDRAGAAAAAMANKPARPGDRACILDFNGVDYAVTDLALIRPGAVWVPLPTSTSVAQLRSFVAETKPSVIASSIDYHAEAVELALTVHTPTRLVVFDYHPGVDDERARGLRCRQVAAGAGAQHHDHGHAGRRTRTQKASSRRAVRRSRR